MLLAAACLDELFEDATSTLIASTPYGAWHIVYSSYLILKAPVARTKIMQLQLWFAPNIVSFLPLPLVVTYI